MLIIFPMTHLQACPRTPTAPELPCGPFVAQLDGSWTWAIHDWKLLFYTTLSFSQAFGNRLSHTLTHSCRYSGLRCGATLQLHCSMGESSSVLIGESLKLPLKFNDNFRHTQKWTGGNLVDKRCVKSTCVHSF